MIRIVLGFLLFVIGMTKLFYSSAGMFFYIDDGVAPEWIFAETVSFCKQLSGADEEVPDETVVTGCTKLARSWLNSTADFILLQWLGWAMGGDLGIGIAEGHSASWIEVRKRVPRS